MQLFLEAVALRGKVVRLLRVHRVAGFCRLRHQLLQFAFAHALQFLLARDDVERQLAEIRRVLVVQAVEHGNVLEQLRLIPFQRGRDIFDVHIRLVIACLHALNAVVGTVEDFEDALGFFRVRLKALQFNDEVFQHLADFARVRRADGLQRALGEIADVLLRIRAEEQHMVRVGDVQLGQKVLNRGALGGGQLALVEAGRGRLGAGLRLRGGSGRHGKRLRCGRCGGSGLLLNALRGGCGRRDGIGNIRREGKHRELISHGKILLVYIDNC